MTGRRHARGRARAASQRVRAGKRPGEATTDARAARREALLDAAVRVVRRDGVRASMDDIASEAGITKPILYRHFGDREGLASAVGERYAAALAERVRSTLGSQQDPRRVLESTVDAYLAFIADEPQVHRFAIHGALAGGGAASLSGVVRNVAGEVALVIGEALRERGLDSGPAEAWAYGLVGMVHLSGDWWLEHRTLPRARLVQYLTTLVWDGMSSLEVTR